MLRKNRTWIAFLLSVILIVGCFPTGIVALESEQTLVSYSNNDSSSFEMYETEMAMGEVVEDKSLREENVKHFRLADGSYEAVIYPQPVHRKDENGEWQDIDNSLALKNDGEAQKYTTSDSRVKFANSFKANSELVTLSEDGYSISMMLLEERTASKVTAIENTNSVTVTNPLISQSKTRSNDTIYDSVETASKIDNKSTILYNAIRANTDIEYVLQGNTLKENIIVNSPDDNYVYRFQMNLVGLRAELSEDGDVMLYDLQDGQAKYIIPAPYMYDNNRTYSTNVTYKLSLVKDDVYMLEISADSSWINAEERAFPVVIDPTISPNRVVWDTYTYSSYPDNNYGHDEDLWVSNYRTTYIKIDLPSLSSGASINNARMYVSYYYYVTSGSLVVSAHQVLESWIETGLKYSNAPQVNSTMLSTATLTASSKVTKSSPGTAYFTITSLVRDWYDGTSTNYGLALKRVSGDNHSVIIKSYEADEDYAYLSINYYPKATMVDGIYQIKNAHTGQYMQASVEATTAETKIQQNNNSYEDYQHFLIRSVGNNEYTIQPVHALNMAICTTSANSGTAVTLTNYDSNNINQRFSISVSDNGYYVIKNKKSDYENALMVLNGSATAGETIYQYAYNSGNLWHHWNLEFAGPESGVYAFQRAGSNSYMSTSATSSGQSIYQTASETSPKVDNIRSALFKIIYRPATQDFVIRSMIYSELIIYPNTTSTGGTPKTLKQANTTDSNISTSYTWKITKASSSSFYIWYQPATTTTKYYLTMQSAGALKLTTTKASATQWVLGRYSTSMRGIEYSSAFPQIIKSGDSKDLSDFSSSSYYYSTAIGDNSLGSITYSVTNISGSATSIATINAHGMLNTISGKAGMIKVTATSEKGASVSKNYYIEPTSGEYFFLQNIQPSGGIDIGYIDGNSSGASKKAMTYDDTQLWQRIPSSWSGYYYIKNVGTGLYLSSPGSTSVDTALSMVSAVTSDLQAWQFSSTPSGAWKIRARPDVISGTNLYININSLWNNTLVQDRYVQNSSYLDEFNVIMLGSDVVYHRTVEGLDDIDPSITIAKLSRYYDGFTLLHPLIHFGTTSPYFKVLALEYLQNAKVMIYNGHGSPQHISVNDKPQKYLRNTDIYDHNYPVPAYTNVDIVIFAGCRTGGNICDSDQSSPFFCCPIYESNGDIHNCNKLGCSCCVALYNLPKSAELAGAKVAIGWHVLQYNNNMNDWIDRFICHMCEIDPTTGKLYTAQMALDKANADTSYFDVDTALLFGTNPNFRFN